MRPAHPIEIIGGGLAGLSLGLALRRRGVSVTLCEAGGYPRHRVCGEFITGLGSGTIDRLGLRPFLDDALFHHDVAWFVDGHLTRRQQLPSPARAVSRFRLDHRLAQAFVAAGGELRTHTRVDIRDSAVGRIHATGRHRSGPTWLGLKIHVRALPLECDLELHLGDRSYVGLTRVEDGRVNLCGLFRRRDLAARGSRLILAYLDAAKLSGLAARLAEAFFDEESFAAVAAVDFDHRVRASDAVTLGDACAMIPPFTGNGMAMAFQSAEAALDPLLAWSRDGQEWTETCRQIRSALGRRFRLRLAAAGRLHPFLLEPPRQQWLRRFAASGLLPLRPLYSLLH